MSPGLDFSYPHFGVGLSSSWQSADDPTNRRMLIAPRRTVFLSPTGASLQWTPLFDGTEAPEDLQKDPDGMVRGLSSGAGSALVKKKGMASIKYKRCGVQNAAPMRGSTKSSISIQVGCNGLTYTSDTEPLGGMVPADAERELKCQRELRTIGLSEAYLPMGHFLREPGSATAVFQVTSDLRVDELILMTLTPSLERLRREGHLCSTA